MNQINKNQVKHIIAFLKESRALGQLPEDMLRQLIPLSSQMKVSAGNTILKESFENDLVFILMSGIVSIYSKGEFIVKLQRRGDIFGEMSVITGETVSASIIADTQVDLLCIKARNIGQYGLEDSESLENNFFRLFSRILSEKLALTTKKARQFEIANRELLTTQKELETANEEALQAVKAKSAFLAMMSHEIRTPLNSIIGNTELLYYTELTEKQEKHVNTVYKSGELLVSIINNILDYSMIEANRLTITPKPFDFADLLKEIEGMFVNEAQKKKIDLKIQYDPSENTAYIGDEIRILQILNNLLDNAIKFTENGSVVLTLDKISSNKSKDLLQFRVEDSGIGISTEKYNDIFNEFSQVDVSTTRRFGGTGLGLAICKRLVKLMGGEIGVDSQEGDGSTFWVRLHLAPAPMMKPD